MDGKHQPCCVWCDASGTAIGVVLESGDGIVEDCSWLRPKDDKRHINLAELNAAVEGLKLAVDYGIKEMTLISDSKTVHDWLSAGLRTTQCVNVHGLHDVVVERRLKTINDIVAETGIVVNVDWVASASNKADKLTRVPASFSKYAKAASKPLYETASVCKPVVHAVLLDEIAKSQKSNVDICRTVNSVSCGGEIADVYKSV